MSTVLWGLLGLIVVYWINYFRCLLKNLAAAKQSGLPYIITPIFYLNRAWLVQAALWLPLLRKLPAPMQGLWVEMLDNDWGWKIKRRPYEVLGSDVFIVVAPGGNSLFVADADANVQITTRRNDFPKPTEMYSSVDIFGKNVVSTEGGVWRQHRKITSPPFTEKNNHMVWLESLHQAKSMISAWFPNGEKDSGPTISVPAAAMRLSLHVISKAGFGVHLQWPHEEERLNSKAGALSEGHTMTYKDALGGLLDNIVLAFLLPRWLLKKLPFKLTSSTYEALINWHQYMQEMYNSKKTEYTSGTALDSGMDLMGALVKGAGISTPDATNAGKGTGQLLTDEEILGNAFVFILAGHETAANTIQFSMLLLAMNPSSQRRLQQDLDDIFGTRPPSQWSYDEDIPRLFGSMAGAVLNESLRLVPPVVGIPKSTRDAPQPLTVNGRHVTIPAKTMITLATPAVQANRRYWPVTCGDGASDAEKDADLLQFRPERWLLDPSSASSKQQGGADADVGPDKGEDVGGPHAADTSSALFKPPRGAYMPFSDGARACLGRRFAQVEVLAVLAVLFREYSVELAVEEILGEQWPFANEEIEVEDLKTDGKGTGRAEWEQARERAQSALDRFMMTIITLQMREGKVPMRIVKRGEERFRY